MGAIQSLRRIHENEAQFNSTKGKFGTLKELVEDDLLEKNYASSKPISQYVYSDTDVAATYSDGYVTVDFAQRAVKVGENALSLTPLEFRMLAAFVRNANQVLSHEQLLVLAWGDSRNVERDQVKLYVGYLRRKLGSPAGEESPIETVRGFGYRYRPPALA